jgi:DNA-binding beta-propeller fold protein YncE
VNIAPTLPSEGKQPQMGTDKHRGGKSLFSHPSRKATHESEEVGRRLPPSRLGANSVVQLGLTGDSRTFRSRQCCCLFVSRSTGGSAGAFALPFASIAARLWLIGALLLTACSPSSPKNALTSRFFDHAEVIGSRGAGAGQFNKPRSLAVDTADNVYVVDLTGRIQKFAPDGHYLFGWQMPETTKGKAKGMITDPDGGVIVVEPHYTRANHFDPTGKVLAQWGVNGTNAGQLAFPRSIGVGAKGDLFISEYSYIERIQHFGPRGTNFIAEWGKPGEGPGEFNRVEGLGIAPNGDVYAADSCNHRVQVFKADGTFVRQFGHAGNGVGELSYPYDVRIDPAGNVFVCEFGNSRIQVFDQTGKSIEIIGGPGGAPGQFTNPWSICLDSKGNLYVADSQNHRVQKLVRKGGSVAGRAKAPAEPPGGSADNRRASLATPARSGVASESGRENLFAPRRLGGSLRPTASMESDRPPASTCLTLRPPDQQPASHQGKG